MTNEEAIKVFELLNRTCKNQPKEVYVAFEKAIEALKNERPKGEWIPVSERLPEEGKTVLIWFEYFRHGSYNCMFHTYGFGYVIDGKWSSFINGVTGWQDYRVIAWQPLPKPYKEADNE